jgi:hypothetical protein
LESKICTFQPHTKSDPHKPKTLNKKRIELLSAQPHSHPIARDPRTLEWEKNKHECTFTPSTSKYVQPNDQVLVNNYDETVDRLRNARRERDSIE